MHHTLCLTLFLSCLLSSTVAAADKFALLVGITRYEHRLMNTTPLKYPEADADAVKKALELGGYRARVLKGKDATLVAIRESLDDFSKQSSADGVALIGLFGHGVQYGETAYFCPSNTDVREVLDENQKPRRDKNGAPMLEPDPQTLISMRELLDAMTKSKAGNRILLADCCRNDPSVARGRNAFGSSLTTKDLPEGTAALFACSRDEQAFEHDDWQHGAFTRSLLNQLENDRTPNLRTGTLADLIHDEVLEMVQQKQQKKQTVTYIAAGIVDLQLKPRGANVPQPNPQPKPQPQQKPRPQPQPQPKRKPQPNPQPQPESLLSESLKIEFVTIPAGSFQMGSPEGEQGRNRDEGPRHTVSVTHDLRIAIHEVTRGQFAAFVQDTGHVTEAEKDFRGGWGFNQATGEFEQDREFNWREPGFSQTDDHPVVNVSWYDANAFCEWLSRKDNRTYRLPTEAEWEYACRGGSTTRYWNGNDQEELVRIANVADGAAKPKLSGVITIKNEDGFVFTAPVGSFLANPYGLHDVHGNVWEWCAD